MAISHRPLSIHSDAHTADEIKMIQDLHKRNPDISMNQMYGNFLEKSYSRHYGLLYRIFCKLRNRKQRVSTKKAYKPQPYDTPKELGIKWQMDVKYVPKACYTGQMPDRFYQYTMLDEASRERYIYGYREQSSYSTTDFVKRAIRYFGYKPKTMQHTMVLNLL